MLHRYPVALQIFLATSVIISSACIPRKVDSVYGKDRESYTSFIGQQTFSWGSDVLKKGRSQASLDLHDLPILRDSMSASHLQSHLQSIMKGRNLGLWPSIFVAHRATVALQNSLAILHSLAQLAPQYAVYSLLKNSESVDAGDGGNTRGSSQWWYVGGLGCSMIIATWIETQSLWMMWSRLVICIRSELTSLLFLKASRMNDVRSTAPQASQNAENISEGQMLLDTHKASPPHISPENLLGVDVKRIVDFVSASHLLPASLCKLIISVVFLYKLLGWQSVLAGIGVLVIMTPLNLYLSKLMTTAQSALMHLRDQKIAVVNEALQGIRQIKFAASEHQWLNRIKHIRERELKKQLYCFILRTALVGIWTLGPVMISAVALTVHALLTGQLLPSVAFTSVAILSQVESSLAIIPKLVMQMMEAAVSAARITHYLDGEELDQYLVHGADVCVVEASISWPATPEDRPVQTILSAINIHFPSGKLSVVSGPSGSGKSLLLAALIGEADKKCGIIAVPRDCSLNVSGGWILPDTIAFVSQVPWIEKDTIRGNIIFGLPLDPLRYAKVLSACALSHDLGILPDGDMTEVGLDGINLSGGQKWRISFARALYSRAGILILDDIFSALDTHVGRHILENALCGQLGESRTRILATHHTDLCIPWASCHVTLANGTIENVLYETVDSPRDLTQSESNTMPSADAGASQSTRPESLLSRDRRNQCSNVLEDESDRGRQSTRDDHRRQDISRQAKSIVGAEKKEIGSVKFKTYKEYVMVSGGLWAVAVVLLTQVGYMVFILGRVSTCERAFRI